MTVSSFARYARAKANIDKGLMALDTDNFSVVLLTSSHTPDLASHETYADISGNEVASGGGYTTGGEDVGAMIDSLVGTAVQWTPSADAVWTGATFVCKYAVVVHRAGGSLVSGDLLLGYCDLNEGAGSISLVSSPLTLTWAGTGLFKH